MINKLAFKLQLPERFPALIPYLNAGRLRPSFFLVGFQKCGTTTVYNQIMQSESMVPGLLKENNELSMRHGNVNRFLLSFPYKWTGDMTGDASHLNGFTPYGIPKIKTSFPDAKLIVIMRAPIKRLVSHFKMDQRIGYIPRSWSLEDYVGVEMKIREGLKNPFSLEENYERLKLFGSQYGWGVTRGMYVIYLKQMLESKMPLHVMFLEKLEQDYQKEMQGLWDYLELNDPIPKNQIANRANYTVDISERLTTSLKEIYREPNERLSKLLSMDLPEDY